MDAYQNFHFRLGSLNCHSSANTSTLYRRSLDRSVFSCTLLRWATCLGESIVQTDRDASPFADIYTSGGWHTIRSQPYAPADPPSEKLIITRDVPE